MHGSTRAGNKVNFEVVNWRRWGDCRKVGILLEGGVSDRSRDVSTYGTAGNVYCADGSQDIEVEAL